VRKSILTIFILFFFITLFSYLLGSCRKDQKTEHLRAMQQVAPAGFPEPLYKFQDNPLTKEGFELGRKLFYDGQLSIDTVHPCASCHQQLAAFGTYEHDRSHGVYNSHTLRNAPVLFNLAWNKSFHWDGEFNSLKDEAAQPINGHVEMGESFQDVIDRLNKDPEYRREFKEVFGYSFIKPEFILKALAQFTGYLTSCDSKYDRYKKGTAVFTAQEESGYQVFQANCATCHPPPLFTDYNLHNIGLPVDPLLNDFGRLLVTGKKEDSLEFKTPSLRSVYISSNYMHDGRFNTLAQCINHYRTGVQQSDNLDPLLKNGIPLTDLQATNLAIFLRTLTDSVFLTDPRFSKP
jgi:cytochrome c peroxidase